MSTVSFAWTDEFVAAIDSNATDITAAKAAAAAARDAFVAAAIAIEDPAVVWPAIIAEDIGGVADDLYASAEPLAMAAIADDLDQLYAFEWPDETGASQAVRAKLGLSADPEGSCVGR